MKQVIYVDELLFINTAVNYFLLLTSSLILKTQVNKFRILFGAFVGGLCAFSVFLPDLGFILSLLLRAAVAFILVFVTFGFKTVSFFLKHFFTLFVSTALFAGIISAIWLMFRSGSMIYVNSALYFDVNIFVLIISSAVCYLIIYFFQKFFKRDPPKTLNYEIEIELSEKRVSGKAFLDTGNRLTEAFSSFPVVVCTKKLCSGLIDGQTLDKLESCNFDELESDWKTRFRIINCRTVSGTNALISFRPDSLKLISGKKSIATDRVYIAVSKTGNYLNEKYDAILPTELFEGEENE